MVVVHAPAPRPAATGYDRRHRALLHRAARRVPPPLLRGGGKRAGTTAGGGGSPEPGAFRTGASGAECATWLHRADAGYIVQLPSYLLKAAVFLSFSLSPEPVTDDAGVPDWSRPRRRPYFIACLYSLCCLFSGTFSSSRALLPIIVLPPIVLPQVLCIPALFLLLLLLLL